MFSISLVTLQLFHSICAEDPPLIEIFTIGVPSFDFQNKSFIVFTKLNQEFRISCTASYPVEWVFHLSKAHFTTSSPNNYTSKLVFTEIGYVNIGEYICTAKNLMGRNSRLYVRSIDHVIDSGHLLPYVLGSILCSLLLISMGVALCFRKALRKQKLRIFSYTEINGFVQGDPQLLEDSKDDYFTRHSTQNAFPYNQKYEIAEKNLKIDQECLLGSGQFGSVFKGKLSKINSSSYTDTSSDITVAVKFSNGDHDATKFKALLAEIKAMAYLASHPNIVSLIGVSTKNIRNREPCIAVEYCPSGSLDVYLRNYKNACTLRNSDVIVITTNMLRWACQIANGLEYIHAKKIVHGDLAIRNILLTKNLIAKIGDFGLAHQLVDTPTYTKKTNCPLPWRNMAIESLRALEFSVKSDMWAFGATLWELFTLGEVPYPGLNYTSIFINLLEKGFRLYKPPLASNAIYNCMLKCWNIDPSLRPEPGEIKSCCYELLLLQQ